MYFIFQHANLILPLFIINCLLLLHSDSRSILDFCRTKRLSIAPHADRFRVLGPSVFAFYWLSCLPVGSDSCLIDVTHVLIQGQPQ
jgi:hypothetical protein